MEILSDNELHSMNVALDRSLNNRAFAVGPGGVYIAEVRSVPWRGDTWYHAYRLVPTGTSSYSMQNDRFCSRAGLVDWLKDNGIRSTRRDAAAYLSRPVWRADLVPADLLEAVVA